MLEVVAGVLLGASLVSAPAVYTLRESHRLLQDERRQNADLLDRLHSRTWEEYKTFAHTEPVVDPHEGYEWQGDDSGMLGSWVRIDDPNVD